MTSTLVIQSHRDPLPFPWLERCIASVRHWAENNGYAHQWIGDELFDLIPEDLSTSLSARPIIASDLGRLYAIQHQLQNFERVIWMDADFLIFNQNMFVLPTSDSSSLGYLIGREVWVQENAVRAGKLKAYVKVHNAFLLFQRENSFLDFYIQHAEKLLRGCEEEVPSQFIGPKLLTAIHNVVGCPVIESAGMLSPRVIDDLIGNDQACCALNLMLKRSKAPIYGANLCSSLADKESDNRMAKLIDRLLDAKELA